MEDGRISYVIDASDKGFTETANHVQQTVNETAAVVEKSGRKIDEVFDNFEKYLEETAASAKVAADKFKESSAEADRLKGELRELAESGAGADELIAKTRELANAQRKAAQDGVVALDANREYWNALNMAGADIGEVQARHRELAESYTDMSTRAANTKAAVEEYSRRLEEEKARLQEVENQSNSTKRSTDNIGSSTKKAAGDAKNFADKLGEVKTGVSGLPGPLGNAVSWVQGLTKASLRFIATPLGAVLAAISAALAAVSSWFKRTEEGQNAMAVGSAYFTQVLNSLLDVVDTVGEWLYNAFTKPKAAMSDLVNFLKGQVLNRLQAVGIMAQGIWKILNGDFTEGFAQFQNGYLQGMTGIKDAGVKASKWMSETNNKANERVRIAQRQNKLDADERKNLVERAKKEAEINELRQKAYDKSVSASERAKALDEAEKKTRSMYDEDLRLAKERYEIVRDTNALGHSNKEDKRKEAEAEAELYRIESQRATALWLMREQNRVDSQGAKDAKAGVKNAEEDAKERQKLFEQEMADRERIAKERQELEDALQDAEIAKIQDNAERERAERRAQYERSLRDIEEQEEQYKKEAYKRAQEAFNATNRDKTKTFADTAVGAAGWMGMAITDEQRAIIKAQMEKLNAEYSRSVEERIKSEEQANREAVNAYLKQYGDYAHKKQAIYDDANAEICKAEEELSKATTAEAKAAAQARIDTVKEETKQQIEELDVQYGKAKAFMIDLFEDAAEKSIGQIQSIIDKYEALVKFLGGDGSVTKEQLKNFGFTDAEIAKALKLDAQGIKEVTDAVKGMKGELGQRSPWLSFKNDIEKATKAIKGANGNDSIIGNAITTIGATAESIMPELDSLATALANIFGIDDSGMKKAIAAMGGLATAAQGVGRIMSQDYVGGGIAVLSGIGTAISSLFGGSGEDKRAKEIAKIDRRLEITNEKLQRLNDELEKSYGVEAEKRAQEARDTIESKKDPLVNALVKSLGFTEMMNFNAIGLGMFGKNSKNLSADEMTKLLESIEDSDVWLSLSDDARKYAEELLGIKDALKDIDNIEKERILGTSFDSVFDTFMNGLYDLADGSEDVFDNIAEDWEKMVNRMVINNLLAEDLKKDLQAWYDQWYADYEDHGFDEQDRAARKKAYEDILQDYAGRIEEMKKDGLLTPLPGNEETSQYFANLRDSWKSALSGMKFDAEEWRKDVLGQIVSDLLDERIFDEAFDTWLADWRSRYTEAIGAGDEQTISELLTELTRKSEEMDRTAASIKAQWGYTEKELEDVDSTFKEMTDSWASALMDMEKTGEDWAEEIGRTMAQKIIEEMIMPTYFQPYLDAIQSAFNDAMSVDGATAESVLDAVLEPINNARDAYDDYKPVVTSIMEALGLIKEEAEEIAKAENPFADLRSTFVSSLMDMKADAKQFGEDIARTLTEQMIDSILKSKFQDEVEHLGEEWQEALDSGDGSAIDRMKKKLADLRKRMADTVDPLLEDLRKLEEEVDETSPFDNLRSNLLSNLMDMESDIADFGKDINRILTEAMIDKFVLGDRFDEQLELWKKEYSRIMGDTDLDAAERSQQLKDLQTIIQAYSEQMKGEAAAIHDLMGTATYNDQQATLNMAEKATYDQFETYLGISMAQQMALEQGNDVRQQILATLQAMAGITSPNGDTARQISMQLRTTNEYLLAIRESNQSILDSFGSKLDQIYGHLARL